MRVATFDLGTNTFRVLIAEVLPPLAPPYKGGEHPPLCKGRSGGVETLTHIRVLREITRLGQDLHKRTTFHPDAVKRSLAALDRFDREIRKEHVDWAGGICTAAFRTAKNGPELLRRIRNRYGWDVRIVSANQEATYAMRGILHGLRRRHPHPTNPPSPPFAKGGSGGISERTLVIDIGGGSTEFIVYDGKVCGTLRRHPWRSGCGAGRIDSVLPAAPSRLRIQTTPLGVVRLTETYLRHDPPLSSEMDRVNAAVDKELVPVRNKLLRRFTLHPSPFTSFVGTAGTVTTLAALKKRMRRYDPKKISGTRLTRRDLESLLRRLIAVPAKSRLKFPGMEKGREDLILAGIAILLRSMDRFGLPDLTVSDSGILEGIALSAHSKHLPIAGGLYPTPPPLTTLHARPSWPGDIA